MRTGTARLGGWLLAVLLTAGPASASFIVAPTLGVRDSAMGGNVVGMPTDGPSVLLHNAAGVSLLQDTEIASSLFLNFIDGRITNREVGFDEKSTELAMVPTLWVGTDEWEPWYFGVGLYGAVGSSFNFNGDPAAGFPNRFLSEVTTVNLGFVGGAEVAPGLRLGAQVAPTYGQIRSRFPSPLGPVAFDTDGFGVTGSVGLLYEVPEDVLPGTTFGINYRGPGIIYMEDGDARVGGESETVQIDFHTPQSLTFGFAYALTDRLLLGAQARWTDYPSFEEGVFEYDRNPGLDRAFITDARSLFRYGLGLEYFPARWARLRAGLSREEWMIEEESITPLLYDATDVLFGGGLGVTFGAWTVDMVAGLSQIDDRVVEPAPGAGFQFPGRYQLGGAVSGIMIRYAFGQNEA